jgi:hypothetical protein
MTQHAHTNTHSLQLTWNSKPHSLHALQVTEEYLRQLGARPLAAALTDLERLLNASGQAADSSDSSSSGPDADALAAGVALQPESQAGLTQLSQLLSEIQLADGVMKLDLGPDTRKTLAALSGERLGAGHKQHWWLC